MTTNVEINSSDRPIHGGLIEAYTNYFEEELQQEYNRISNEKADDLTISEEELQNFDYEHFVKRRVRQIIFEHTPKQRLEVYLEWNGILGYCDTVYGIAIGNLFVKEW